MMMPGCRCLHAIVALAALLVVTLGHGWSDASAATINYAGVVVRHGDGQMAYAYIGFEEAEINGIELLKRSGLDVVTVSFGGLGEGVCSIDEHGCPSTDCRKRVCQGPKPDDPFWQYFRQATAGGGDWTAMALGGSGAKVHNGDIDGWSWTGTTAQLPPLILAEVAQRAGYNGTSAAGSPASMPVAVFRREGVVATSDDGQSTAVYAAAAGVLLLSVIAMFALTRFRARRAIES